jgi:hypothetical protein
MGILRRCFSARTAPVLLWVLGITVFFRGAALSLFTRVIGDDGDGQLIVSLHEHWYRVMRGLEGWNETLFFHPFKHALGYSDTFFATGLLYSVLRHFGLDQFLALQGVYLLLATLGYGSMYLWLHRYRGLGRLPAAIGALLLIIASPVYLAARNSHLQLLSVWLLPIGILLLEQAFAAVQARRAPWAYYLGFAFWFGFLAYSTFYIAFFFALLCLIGLAGGLLLHFRKGTDFIVFNYHEWRQSLPALAAGGLWGSLFLVTYLPARKETGGRVFEELLPRLPTLADILNHTDTNLLWGPLNTRFWPYADPHNTELALGLTPLLALLAGTMALYVFLRPSLRAQPVMAIAAVVLCGGMALLVREGDFILWKFIFETLPGAEAIRVPSRLNVVLVIPAILLGAHFLHYLFSHPTGLWRKVGGLLAVLLVAEQIQLVDSANLHRAEKLRLASRATPPPAEAEAFLAFSEPWRGWNRDVPQNTAIFLAEQWGLPTINGRSGFAPPQWNFFNMDPGAALHALAPWAQASGMTNRVALYDISTNTWFRTFDFALTGDASLLDIDLLSLAPDRFNALVAADWSGHEPWGLWSDGATPTLVFQPVHFPEPTAALSLVARAFLHLDKPTSLVGLIVNGRPIKSWTLTLEQPVVREIVRLPADIGPIREMVFDIAEPVSPASLGVSSDERLLGIGLESLIFHGSFPE